MHPARRPTIDPGSDAASSVSPPRLVIVAAITLLMLAACAPAPEEEAEIEPVEITGSPTDNLTPDDDAVERRGAGGFAGQLPAGFPAELPVPASSSVAAQGPGRVVFATADAVERTRSDLELELSRAGWSRSDDGSWTRAGQRVTISFDEATEGSTITYRF